MQCPQCGAPSLVHDTRDVPYVYKGEKTRIPAVEADYCSTCGEAVMDRAAGDRYGALIQAFQRQVNAGLVDPAYISRVRTKLQLGKKEAAEIFGGGVNAFSRYESGKSRPPVALVKLLKVLDHHPELLAEIRA